MPTYTINGDHNQVGTTNNLEASYVNFSVLTGGTVVISATNTAAPVNDVVVYLYRIEANGALTFVADADVFGAAGTETLTQNLQAGNYVLIFSEYAFGNGVFPDPTATTEVFTGVNTVAAGDEVGGTWEVVIRDDE